MHTPDRPISSMGIKKRSRSSAIDLDKQIVEGQRVSLFYSRKRNVLHLFCQISIFPDISTICLEALSLVTSWIRLFLTNTNDIWTQA
jgi:hypothetical protein